MSHFHFKFQEALTLVKANIPILLTGEKGSGKTTLAKQITEELKLPFFSMSMTRQTTLSHLMGFLSVNGTYIPSQLRAAVESGGVMLLDEIDAADANVLLSLNTIENGYVSFPTGIVECHPDFRLIATANPQKEHHHYTGRTKLDAATLDRFDIIEIPRDSALEKTLIDINTYNHMELLREVIKKHNSSIVISMRDSIRYQKRKELDLLDGYVERILEHNDILVLAYKNRVANLPKYQDQKDCKTFDDLFTLIKAESTN